MKIDITSIEIEALAEVLNYCADDEYKDAQVYLYENGATNVEHPDDTDPDTATEEELGGHVYWHLKVLEKMYNRIKTQI